MKGKGDAIAHAKTEAFSLAGFVVGVLAQKYDANAIERAQVESIKDLRPRRKARTGLILGTHEVGQLRKIIAGKLFG